MSKINLEIKDYSHEKTWRGVGNLTQSVKQALPYYKSRKGTYTHIVRSAAHHWQDGSYTHTSLNFWCGGGGFLGEKGRLYSEVDKNEILCASCYGRYIGAGMEDSRRINGQYVLYKPRK